MRRVNGSVVQSASITSTPAGDSNNTERHTMIKRTLTPDTLRNWAFGQLSLAQHHFALNPNASNWGVTIRAMFIYQQTDYALRGYSIDIAALLKRLAPMHQQTWGDEISMTTVGLLVRDAVSA